MIKVQPSPAQNSRSATIGPSGKAAAALLTRAGIAGMAACRRAECFLLRLDGGVSTSNSEKEVSIFLMLPDKSQYLLYNFTV